MKEFLEYVARSLVDKPDSVFVEVEDDGDETILTLGVDQEDMSPNDITFNSPPNTDR